MKKSRRKLLLSRETLRSLEESAVGVAGGIERVPGTLLACTPGTGETCCCTMAPICYNEPSNIQLCFP
jgi:hypothetical protein